VAAGPEETKNPAGQNVLRPIQIRLPIRVLQESHVLVKPIRHQPESQLLIPQRSQLFICTHNETLSIVAVCVCNPDRSPVGINRCDTAPTPTGFAEKADHRAIHFRIKAAAANACTQDTSQSKILPQHANERQATAYCQKTREWL
jgi:hypothetical protein